MYTSFCFTLLLLARLVTSQESVKLTLFYESLCPYCQDFVVKQLYPTYKLLGSALNVDLVPYGIATRQFVNGTWKFVCQHGSKECHGNKIQACVLYENSIDETVRFVGCIMAKPEPSSDKIAKECALQNNIPWGNLKICIGGKIGDEYLADLGSRTEKIELKYVPHFLFNDKFNRTLEDEGRNNLVKVICDLLQNKPSPC